MVRKGGNKRLEKRVRARRAIMGEHWAATDPKTELRPTTRWVS